jgi:hypothetical protein
MVFLKGYMASCGELRGSERCGPKPPSKTSAITCLYDIRSPRHLHSPPLHLHPRHPPSCIYIPIGCSLPHLPVHNEFITEKARRRVSYNRDRVHLTSEISNTNIELSISHRSMQIGSRTLQKTISSSRRDLLMQLVVSSGLQ